MRRGLAGLALVAVGLLLAFLWLGPADTPCLCDEERPRLRLVFAGDLAAGGCRVFIAAGAHELDVRQPILYAAFHVPRALGSAPLMLGCGTRTGRIPIELRPGDDQHLTLLSRCRAESSTTLACETSRLE